MEQFNPIYEVKLETKYHYKKEVFECNQNEIEPIKEELLQNFNTNFRLFSKYKHIDHLFKDKKWREYECLIVGPGPTLDEDIKYIKQYRNNVKIICTDSALNPLMTNNIKPDFVFTKGMTNKTVELFKDLNLKDVKIVANLLQKPELFKKIKADFYFYLPYDDIIILDNFIKFYPQIPKLLLKSSTLVMAFILARCMNFRYYYLLGADFCFEDRNKFYCKNVLYKSPVLNDSDIVRPESIFLNQISTTLDLFHASEDFFRIIAVESLDHVLNCSRNSILYNVNWVYFNEVMKRFNTTKRNAFEFASVEHSSNDDTIDKMNDITCNYFKATAARSMFENIERVSQEKNLNELYKRKEEFSQKNCVVCGAGPSLSETLELLKQNRDKFIVFGVDASLMPLYKVGIEPDYILSIDPCNLSLFFKDYHGDKTSLLASVHMHPRAVESWKNHIYFYYPVPIKRFDYWMLALIEKYSKIQFLEPLSNCGSTVLYLAFKLGFKNIAIMGMDFSFTGNRMYTPNTVAEQIIGIEEVDNEEKILKNLSKYGPFKTINCKGDTVYTDKIYSTYAKTLEGLVSTYKIENIINVSTSILKIPYMPFDEYLNKVINN